MQTPRSLSKSQTPPLESCYVKFATHSACFSLSNTYLDESIISPSIPLNPSKEGPCYF
jgi:hypothetical protein